MIVLYKPVVLSPIRLDYVVLWMLCGPGVLLIVVGVTAVSVVIIAVSINTIRVLLQTSIFSSSVAINVRVWLYGCLFLLYLPPHPLSSDVAPSQSTVVASASAASMTLMLLLHWHLYFCRGLLHGRTIYYLSHSVNVLQHLHLQSINLLLLHGVVLVFVAFCRS